MRDYYCQLVSTALHLSLLAYVVYSALPPKPLASGHGLTVELIAGQTPKGNSLRAPKMSEKLVAKQPKEKPIIIAKIKPAPQKAKVVARVKHTPPKAKVVTPVKQARSKAKPPAARKVITQQEESFVKINFALMKPLPPQDLAPQPAVAPQALQEIPLEKIKARVAKVDSIQPGQVTEQKTTLAEALGTPEGIRDARQIQQVPGNLPPSYPVEDRLKRREGRVILVAYVNPEGLVEDAQVEESTGSYAMNQESIRAFYKYQFIKQQPGWVRMPFEFQLVGPAQQYGAR